MKKTEKMGYVRFLPKAVTIHSKKEEEFDCKTNYRCGKLTSFWFDNISKINCRTLVVLSYTSSGLESKKV